LSKENNNKQRVAKVMSQRGVCSRREAERWIAEGRVMINGSVLEDTSTPMDPDNDELLVDGQIIHGVHKHYYLAFNKPQGVLSSFKRGKEKGYLLGDVLNIDRHLFPAGRLDRDSKGLLILTSDGKWANRVMHPNYDKSKEYLVIVKKHRPTQAAKKFLKASFEENGVTFKAFSVAADGSYVRIVLKEGRNRQIRRLAEAEDMEVKELIRVRVGDVLLGNLKEGKYRKLSKEEILSLDKEK